MSIIKTFQCSIVRASITLLLFFSVFTLPLSALTINQNQIVAINAGFEDQLTKSAFQNDTPASEGIGTSRLNDGSDSLVVFSNSSTITINDRPAGTVPGTATPYPSNIVVSGLTGTVTNITVSLSDLDISRPRETDVLLVAPTGQTLLIMGDVGGLTAINNVNLTFSDAAATSLSGAAITSGTYRPTDEIADVNPDAFPAPAPAGPYNRPAPTGTATLASTFNGINPNGTWSLYVVDDAQGGPVPGSITGGWSLDITVSAASVPTTTTLVSSLNPSFRNQAVSFTATVASGSGTPTGSVTFREGATALPCGTGGTVNLNASGQAVCSVAANTFSEGSRVITATYNPTGSFTTSSGSVTQVVNNTTTVSGNTFSNTGIITVTDGSTATPYPSNIFVSGLTGSISKVTLTLTNANIPRPREVDFLLVAPGGQKFIPVSDVGDATAANSVTLTLDDAAAAPLPTGAGTTITGGTFRPTDANAGADTFPAPAPAAPYNSPAPNGTATFASTFNGTNPNGTWSLYVVDDAGGGGNTVINGGWGLTFTTTGDAATTTALASSQNPSFRNQAVTFTATVTTEVSTPVTTGTVTFREGATILSCGTVALNASGQAICTIPANGFTSEGSRVITASYNGIPGSFNISNGSVTQIVNNPTTISGNQFSNTGAITVTDGSTATPYPSNIFVTGLGGTITKVTLSLNNTTLPRPREVDFLLVAPGGQRFVPVSDVGDLTAANNINLVLDDAAASALPNGAGTVITGGTFRPTDANTGTDNFPAPAPAGSYNRPAPTGSATFASVFNGTNPNGTWSLYVVDDAIGGGNSTVAGGWTLTFNLTPTATTTTVTSSINPSVFGQPVTFTATVASPNGTPTGNVQFFDGAASLGTVALNALGVATLSTSTLPVGTRTITAQYAGASTAGGGGFNASNGTLSGGQTVNQAGVAVAVTSSQNPIPLNTNVTFTAAVTANAPSTTTPTGTVNFFRNGLAITGCANVTLNGSGRAFCTTQFINDGLYRITAQYVGNSSFAAGNNNSSPFVQTVGVGTAASVPVGGRVTNGDGRGISKAVVIMVDASGTEHFAITNPFGYYRFVDVPAGQSYLFTVSAKGYTFIQQSVLRTINEETDDINFVGGR